MIGINISFEGFLCLNKSVRVGSDSAEFSCKSFFENVVDSPSFSLFRPCNINLEYWTPYKSPSLCIVGHVDSWRVNSYDLFQKRRPLSCSSPSWCFLCKKDNETNDHILLLISFSSFMWVKELNVLDHRGALSELWSNFLSVDWEIGKLPNVYGDALSWLYVALVVGEK